MEKQILRRFGVYPVIILSMLFWGMSYVWTSIVFKYYHPITTIILRLIISSLILLAFIMLTGKAEKIRKQDFGIFLLSALFNPFLYFLGENFGLKYSSPTISSVIIATIPLFTPVVAYFTLHEKLSLVNLLGIIISFAGIGIMVVNPDLSLNASPWGIALLLGAVAFAITYSVMLRKLATRYSALTIIAYQNVIGSLYFLPFFLIFDLHHFLTINPNFELISSILSLAIFASSFAYILYTMAVSEIGVSRTNVFTNLIPVFTAIFSFIFISEIFSTNKIVGMLIVIFGVVITQVKKKSSVNQTIIK